RSAFSRASSSSRRGMTRQRVSADVCSSWSGRLRAGTSASGRRVERRGGLVRGTGRSWRYTALVGVIVLTLVAAACGSSSKKSSGNNSSSSGGGKTGGSLVFGAEQWPDCINPITQCANSSWLQWLVPIHVLPRLTELDDKNNFVASPLLTDYPTTENGGVTDAANTFTVTYHLNPDAKWDDRTPITSADVQFPLPAYLHPTGSL